MYGRVVTMVLVGTLALGGVASQALSQTAPYDQSFIDADNDGVWSQGDEPLQPYLDADGSGFDARFPQAGWSPKTRPVGIVLQGKTYFTAEDTELTATGNVIVRGIVQTKGPERWVTIETMGGDITIEPKARIKGTGDFVFEALYGGNIYVGEGASLQSKGEQTELGFRADGALYLDSGVQMKIGGYYPWITLRGADGVFLAPGVRIQGSNHSQIDILTDADLDLFDVYLKAGYLRIQAQASLLSPAAKRIHVADSFLAQTYRNGDFRMWAQPALGTTRYAEDAILIERSVVLTKEDLPLYLPEPTIR